MGSKITHTTKKGVIVQVHSTLGLPKALETFRPDSTKKAKNAKNNTTPEITRQIADKDRYKKEEVPKNKKPTNKKEEVPKNPPTKKRTIKKVIQKILLKNSFPLN